MESEQLRPLIKLTVCCERGPSFSSSSSRVGQSSRLAKERSEIDDVTKNVRAPATALEESQCRMRMAKAAAKAGFFRLLAAARLKACPDTMLSPTEAVDGCDGCYVTKRKSPADSGMGNWKTRQPFSTASNPIFLFPTP
jgi:hypothetical protein